MAFAGIDPGCVRVQLGYLGGRVTEVRVSSERPAIVRQLRGRPADEAVRLLPLLFALCGKAQGRAAALALDAARGSETTSHLDPAIEREVQREHLWRWLLDLPALLGEAPLRQEFVAASGWIAAGQRQPLAELLGGSRIESLRTRLANGVEDEDVAASLPRLLPMLDARASLGLWPQFDPKFCQAPHLDGAAAETGALARRQGGASALPARNTASRAGNTGAFAARWLARLDEACDWAQGRTKVGAGGTASAAAMAPGRGRSLVETARGVLMHEIVLDGDRIAEYFIVAPTEWNFHPQGVLRTWLMGRDATDRVALKDFVGTAVAALDPCVGWELSDL